MADSRPRDPSALTLLVPAVVALATTAALAAVPAIFDGWPGAVGASGVPFCERFRPGLVAQPANTFSNLGFVAVALLIGWRARRDLLGGAAGGAPAPRNRMTAGVFYPAFYAGVAAFLGPGSAAMHASTTRWGGRVDVLSMYLFILWVIAFAWVRLRDGSQRDFLRLYVPATLILGIPHLAGWIPISSDLIFAGLVVTAAALEIAVRRAHPGRRARRGYLLGAGACFLLAFGIWIPSRTDGPLCAPDSLLQGHAVWHLLCAGSVWLLYCYARSERDAVAG